MINRIRWAYWTFVSNTATAWERGRQVGMDLKLEEERGAGLAPWGGKDWN